MFEKLYRLLPMAQSAQNVTVYEEGKMSVHVSEF